MTNSNPATFYASLDRLDRLREQLQPRFQWTADSRAVSWSFKTGGVLQHFEWTLGEGAPRYAGTPVAPTSAPEDRAWARTYLHEVYLVPEMPTQEAESPDGCWMASVRQGNVWLRSTRSDDERQITQRGDETAGWDIDGRGVDPWSPNGNCLFAVHVDRTRVARVVRPRFEDGSVSADSPRQQRAGEALDVAQPYIVPFDGGEPKRIELGDMRDHYVRLLGWLPDASAVLLARYSRTLDQVELFRADARTGQAHLFMRETSETFLQHCQVIWSASTGFTLLPGARFLWLSEREGWNHLYLGDLATGELQRLTSGKLVVRDVVRTDANWAYVRASEDGARPYDLHLYRVPLAGDVQTRLTEENGQHELAFSPDGAWFVDTFSTPEEPPRSVLRTAEGVFVHELFRADPVLLEGSGWTRPEPFSCTAADGLTPLFGLLYRPAGFDPARRYPLVHWLYGGPQIQEVAHTFCPRPGRSDAFLQALANAGYLVLTLDARGTPGRSKEFQDVVYRQWGEHVVADHAHALRQLMASRTYIDPKRRGAGGRARGGYFALRLLAQAPELYRAAVSVVPGFDPYGGILYEPYLGLPQEDPEPYRSAELWQVARQIIGRVLLIGGTLDTSTLWDMHRMAQVLIDADVAHQMLVFPEQEHSFTGPARRFHYRSIRDFFDEALSE